jgi:hypothetical protein
VRRGGATWKSELQSQSTHTELYFFFPFVPIPCLGVNIQTGGVSFRTSFVVMLDCMAL